MNNKNEKKPKLKAIHICNSLQPTHKPKISKEYVLLTLAFELNKKHWKIWSYFFLISDQNDMKYSLANFFNKHSSKIINYYRGEVVVHPVEIGGMVFLLLYQGLNINLSIKQILGCIMHPSSNQRRFYKIIIH